MGQNVTNTHMTHVILFTEVLVCPQLSSLSCMCRAARRSAVLHFISTAKRSCSTSPTLWKHTHSSSCRKNALTALQKNAVFSADGENAGFILMQNESCSSLRAPEAAVRQSWQKRLNQKAMGYRHGSLFLAKAKVQTHTQKKGRRVSLLLGCYTCRNRYSKAEGSSCSRSAGSLGMKHTLNRHL